MFWRVMSWRAMTSNRPPGSDRLQRRHMLAIPLFKDRLGRVGERTLQIAPYARHMSQILRFAVAGVEPGENPQDLAGALGRERDVALDESWPVEFRLPGPAALDVAAKQRQLGLFRHVDAGILEDRGKVIAARAHQGVLEVEKPNAPQLMALRQPQQIGRMVVAQHPGRRLLDRRLQRLAPEHAEGCARLFVDRGAEAWQIPV